jgi:glutamine synthetase
MTTATSHWLPASSQTAGNGGLLCLEVTDLACVSRSKVIPMSRLRDAAEHGVAAPVFAFFGVDDHVAEIGDRQPALVESRLVPDTAAMVPLWRSPGLTWAPADQCGADLAPLDTCPRSFLKSQLRRASQLGVTFVIAFEVEFTVFSADDEVAHNGPGYGSAVIFELEDFIADLFQALSEQGLRPEQFHAEYSPGQCEITVAPRAALAGVDTYLLLRLTIRRVARAHGLRVSFAPIPAEQGLANGAHLHWSAWRDGGNLLAPVPGTDELGGRGGSLAAGMLRHLPEVLAILAPSILSYRRLQPSHWASAFVCWGFGNREAALRVIRGPDASDGTSTNVEVKPIDGATNPYLAVGALIGAALAGLEEKLALPPEVQTDPALLPESTRTAANIMRLPSSLAEAIQAMESSDFARGLLGSPLRDYFLAIRKDELNRLASLSAERLIALYRYRY